MPSLPPKFEERSVEAEEVEVVVAVAEPQEVQPARRARHQFAPLGSISLVRRTAVRRLLPAPPCLRYFPLLSAGEPGPPPEAAVQMLRL